MHPGRTQNPFECLQSPYPPALSFRPEAGHNLFGWSPDNPLTVPGRVSKSIASRIQYSNNGPESLKSQPAVRTSQSSSVEIRGFWQSRKIRKRSQTEKIENPPHQRDDPYGSALPCPLGRYHI